MHAYSAPDSVTVIPAACTGQLGVFMLFNHTDVGIYPWPVARWKGAIAPLSLSDPIAEERDERVHDLCR